MTTLSESSTKPYFIRALHEWCIDNGYTPHIVVTVDENTVVPEAHIQDGQITLNIGALATNNLSLGNEYIDFQARFSGKVEHIFVPIAAVSAIYARETGAGMGFEVEVSKPYASDDTTSGDKASSSAKQSEKPNDGPDDDNGGRPHLTIVK